MKKLFSAIAVLLALTSVSCAQGNKSECKVVGKLTAYYANKDFGEYTKGKLIVDSNDPINRIVNLNATKYKYEGDDTGAYYSSEILKSDVTVKAYTMNELPVSFIGDGMLFVSEEGDTAKIFKSNNNGHEYFTYDDDWNPIKDQEATKRLDGCYVLSYNGSFENEGENFNFIFEEQLETENDHIKMYVQNRFGDEGVRYREGKIGFIEEEWINGEDYPEEKPGFGANGELLTDQYSTKGSIADYISIAYIDSLKALYINGKLYYQK